MLTAAAISLSKELEKIGSFAGLAAFFGFAVLTVLYFAQAREVKRLREWAGRAPERAAELEHRVVAAADARRIRAEPVRKPATVPATPAGAAAAKPAAAAGAASPAGAGAEQVDGAAAAGQKPAEPAAVPAEAAAVAAGAATGAAAGAAAVAGAGAPAVPAAAGAGAPAAPAAAGAATPGAPATAGAGAAAPAAAGAAAPGPAEAGGPPAPAPAAPGAGVPHAPAPEPAEDTGEAAALGNGTSTDIPAVPPRATPPPPRPLPPRRPLPAAAPLRSTRPTATPRRAGAVHSQRHTPVAPPEGRSRARLALISGGSVIGILLLVLVATQLLGGGEEQPQQPNVALNETPTPTPAQEESTPASGDTGTTTRSDVTVAVLNGTTTPGLAATIADRVASAGFAKGVITNFTDSQRSASLIFYAPDKANAAREVSKVLRLTGADRQPMNQDVQALSNGADVVVVVGADQTQ